MLFLAAVTMTVVCTLPGMATAQVVDGQCKDAIIGGGLVHSTASGGTALFGLAAGYLTPGSPLGGVLSVIDKKGGFSMKALTVDSYVGFHCAGFDPSGGPCYERSFTGMAQVTQNKVTTMRPYLVDTIITPSSTAPDYVSWVPNGCTDLNNCFISLQLVSAGLMFIWNPDTTTPGCF